MITFSIILLMLLIVAIPLLLAVGAGAMAIVLTFGDIIVCVLLISWIIKAFAKKNKN